MQGRIPVFFAPFPVPLSRKSHKAPVALGLDLLSRLRSQTEGREAIMARGTEAARALPGWLNAPEIRRCRRSSQFEASLHQAAPRADRAPQSARDALEQIGAAHAGSN